MKYACLRVGKPNKNVRKVKLYIGRSNNGHGKPLIVISKRMNLDLLGPSTVQAMIIQSESLVLWNLHLTTQLESQVLWNI